MPRLVLLSNTTGYQAGAFRQAAGGLGIALTLATDRCHVLEDPWRDGAIPVRFEDPEGAARQIVEFARANPIAGMVAIGDPPALTAALACQQLGIDYHSPEGARAAGNKFLARESYREAGLPTPWYARLAVAEDPEPVLSGLPFPCVLKPLGLSASRGVIRVDDAAEFRAAFARIRALLGSPDVRGRKGESADWILVESFIPGREVAVEGIVTRGRLKVLAVFDKPDPLDGPFFEETLYITPARIDPAVLRAVVAATERAVQALDLRQGPMHAELRIQGSEACLLEVAARPIGGLCARALRFGAGMPLEELILRHALRESLEGVEREQAAAGVMMIPIPREGVFEGVEGLEAAAATPGVEGIEITAKLGQKLVPLPEGSSYLGFIFARAETPDSVERALRGAHEKLRFGILTSLPVVP